MVFILPPLYCSNLPHLDGNSITEILLSWTKSTNEPALLSEHFFILPIGAALMLSFYNLKIVLKKFDKKLNLFMLLDIV